MKVPSTKSFNDTSSNSLNKTKILPLQIQKTKTMKRSTSSFAVPSTPSRRTSMYSNAALKTPISKPNSRRESLGFTGNRQPFSNLSLNTSLNSSFNSSLTTPKRDNRRGSVMPSNSALNTSSSFIPSTPLFSNSTIHHTSTSSLPSFYEMKRKDEEQNQKIEQLESEIQALKNLNSELQEKVKQKVEEQQSGDIQWQQKFDQYKNETNQQLHSEQQNVDQMRETTLSLERKLNQLKQLNNVYSSKLEGYGMNPIELTELQYTENELKRKEEIQNQFNENIGKIQQQIQTVNQQYESQQNIMKEHQSELKQLLDRFHMDCEDKELDVDSEYVSQMQQRLQVLYEKKQCIVSQLQDIESDIETDYKNLGDAVLNTVPFYQEVEATTSSDLMDDE
jgi:hypothetical protein